MGESNAADDHSLVPAQAKAKIMVIRDIERDDIDFISKTLHCMPISHVDHMRPEKLGHASIVEEKQVRSLTMQGRSSKVL